MLTLKQIAERSGIGPSLAAFYRDKYEEYLKYSGEGRHRKYDESNADLFRLIAQRYKAGMDYEQIKQELDNEYGVLVGNDNKPKVVKQDLMESIRSVFIEELNKRDSLILELREELESIKETLIRHDERDEDRDKRLEERDRDIMQRLREIAEEKRPWWKRIFKIPPLV